MESESKELACNYTWRNMLVAENVYILQVQFNFGGVRIRTYVEVELVSKELAGRPRGTSTGCLLERVRSRCKKSGTACSGVGEAGDLLERPQKARCPLPPASITSSLLVLHIDHNH